MDKPHSVTLDFGDRSFDAIEPENLKLMIKGAHSANVKIPIPYCHTMSDVAYSHLEASYILETLAKSFKTSNLSTSSSDLDMYNYDIRIEGFTSKELYPLLEEFSCILRSNECIDEDERFHYYEKLNEYESNLTSMALVFPDVADDYFANLLNGGIREMELDTSDKSELPPEYKYGYWQSTEYNKSDDKVLVSTSCWIAPNNIDLTTLLGNPDTEKALSFLPANLLVINSQAMVVSENGVLGISMGEVIQGIACVHELFPEKSGYYPHFLDQFNGSFFSNSGNYLDFNSTAPNSFWQDNSNFELYASEFEEFLVFKTKAASLILFNVSQPSHSKSKTFVNAMLTIASTFEDGVLLPPSITLDWSSFNDEQFEKLCYDIIYHSSKFDNNTIRKMGNSRSRDGGRDIEVYTHKLNNKKAKKYIFQCKFTTTHKSINTSNIGSVSDVIDQYGADGYGVFCNTVIDSTLYDRLDGIKTNRKIEIETWSNNEIERFISRRPSVNQRYFSYVE